MCSEDGIFVIPLLDLEAEIDLIARGFGETGPSEVRPKRSHGREARFSARRGTGIVSRVERFLRLLCVICNCCEPGREEFRDIRPGKLRERLQTGSHAVKQRGFIFAFLAGEGAVDELIAHCTAPTAAAAESGQRRQPAHPLTFMVAASIRADFRIGAAEQRVIVRGIDSGQFDSRCAGSAGGRCWWSTRATPSCRGTTGRGTSESAGEVEFLRLPRAETGLDLFGKLRGIAGGAPGFAGENRGGFMEIGRASCRERV